MNGVNGCLIKGRGSTSWNNLNCYRISFYIVFVNSGNCNLVVTGRKIYSLAKLVVIRALCILNDRFVGIQLNLNRLYAVIIGNKTTYKYRSVITGINGSGCRLCNWSNRLIIFLIKGNIFCYFYNVVCTVNSLYREFSGLVFKTNCIYSNCPVRVTRNKLKYSALVSKGPRKVCYTYIILGKTGNCKFTVYRIFSRINNLNIRFSIIYIIEESVRTFAGCVIYSLKPDNRRTVCKFSGIYRKREFYSIKLLCLWKLYRNPEFSAVYRIIKLFNTVTIDYSTFKVYVTGNKLTHSNVFYSSKRLFTVKLPGKGNRFTYNRFFVYIITGYFNCMRTFFEVVCIKIVRPEFCTFGNYKLFMLGAFIKEEFNLGYTVIINTGTYNIKVTYNAHVRIRVGNTTDRTIRFRVYIEVKRTFDVLVATKVGCRNDNIILNGFFLGFTL